MSEMLESRNPRKRHIGKLLRRERKRRKLTADQVGEACNVSRSRVYQWEGEKHILPKNFERLAKVLRVPLAVLETENKKSR